MALLNGGSKFGSFKVGFFRSEGKDLYRIGQTGVKNAQEIRLYICPNAEKSIMFLLALGTKGTKKEQNTDIVRLQALIRKQKLSTDTPISKK